MSPVQSVTYVAGLYQRCSRLRPVTDYYYFTFLVWAEAAELGTLDGPKTVTYRQKRELWSGSPSHRRTLRLFGLIAFAWFVWVFILLCRTLSTGDTTAASFPIGGTTGFAASVVYFAVAAGLLWLVAAATFRFIVPLLISEERLKSFGNEHSNIPQP